MVMNKDWVNATLRKDLSRYYENILHCIMAVSLSPDYATHYAYVTRTCKTLRTILVTPNLRE